MRRVQGLAARHGLDIRFRECRAHEAAAGELSRYLADARDRSTFGGVAVENQDCLSDLHLCEAILTHYHTPEKRLEINLETTGATSSNVAAKRCSLMVLLALFDSPTALADVLGVLATFQKPGLLHTLDETGAADEIRLILKETKARAEERRKHFQIAEDRLPAIKPRSNTPSVGAEKSASTLFYCNLCNVSLNGGTQWLDHAGGKKHRKKLILDSKSASPACTPAVLALNDEVRDGACSACDLTTGSAETEKNFCHLQPTSAATTTLGATPGYTAKPAIPAYLSDPSSVPCSEPLIDGRCPDHQEYLEYLEYREYATFPEYAVPCWYAPTTTDDTMYSYRDANTFTQRIPHSSVWH